ncbi:MAG: porin family protein [Cyclobacteriaceae bacterium]
MKKLNVLVVLLFVCSSAFAQFGLGVKGGLNFANLSIDDASSRTGFHFGAFAHVPLSENIGIQPEVLFSTQGADIDNTDVNMSYVNVPVLLRLRLIQILNVHFGPQFGFPTKAKADGEDILDNIKDSDISLAFGAGINLPLGLEAGARYNLGVSDISDSGIDFQDAQHRVFQVYVAWRLLGKG